jgi:hypothetical protein
MAPFFSFLAMTVFGLLLVVVNGVATAGGGAEGMKSLLHDFTCFQAADFDGVVECVACLRSTSASKGCDGLCSDDKLGDCVRAVSSPLVHHGAISVSREQAD